MFSTVAGTSLDNWAWCRILHWYPGDLWHAKGVPAWESCTSTWLVSPAAGCEKKKNGGLHNRASDYQIEYTRTYFIIYK